MSDNGDFFKSRQRWDSDWSYRKYSIWGNSAGNCGSYVGNGSEIEDCEEEKRTCGRKQRIFGQCIGFREITGLREIIDLWITAWNYGKYMGL